ncbi:predicted protein [Naegleria gruberi]|uniref:Predicted protein n=1 Tax=Naegleria gruberi TaxID=5762 RepID=D2VEE8_NAEGR|nr:uncharacterized protein NAEGRDRAFT_67253 [Naegleria gruberi]EFC44788.1 predicted protein [Naegleria gruberi]|eukprot:XP_002677532.1 predicted protein [Naegleria gruberi strain NEG-M]
MYNLEQLEQLSLYVMRRFGEYFQVVSAFSKINNNNSDKIEQIRGRINEQRELLDTLKKDVEINRNKYSESEIKAFEIEIEKSEKRLAKQVEILHQYENQVDTMHHTTFNLSFKLIVQVIIALTVLALMFYMVFFW